MSNQWSDYQKEIFSTGCNLTKSFIIDAKAGAGKTTVLVELANRSGLGSKMLFLAFNKAIVNTLQVKMPGNTCSTLHSLGYRTLRNNVSSQNRGEVDAMKYASIFRDQLKVKKKFPQTESVEYQFNALMHYMMVTMAEFTPDGMEAMADEYAVNIPCDTDEAVTLCLQALAIGRRAAFENGIVNFDEMLYWPAMERWDVGTYHTVAVDEAQDLSKVQHALIDLIKRNRLIACGDPNQCQPEGTLVRRVVTKSQNGYGTSLVPIESLKVGDYVLSYVSKEGRMNSSTRITQAFSRPYQGKLITVSEPISGNKSSYTPNHFCMANFKPLARKPFVYLSRKGDKYRIGMSSSKAMAGASRMHGEDADAMWILKFCENRSEALIWEQAISGRFGIPQLMFNEKHFSTKTYQAWDFIGTATVERAIKCLEYFGKDLDYPIFTKDDSRQQSLLRPLRTAACNLFNGVLMLVHDYSFSNELNWRPVILSEESYEGNVISLDVERTHNYIADNIVTYNSIYGFAGAACNSMGMLASHFELESKPLSICYRCGQNIVRHAQKLVPQIEYWDQSPAGVVRTTLPNNLADELTDGCVVICRTNAPLVSLCFKLIKQGIRAKIKGRDVGDQLIQICKQLAQMATFEIDLFPMLLERWAEKETHKIIQRGGKRVATLVGYVNEKVSCLMSFYDNTEPAGISELINAIKALFTDDTIPGVTLMSGHKSKGLEFDKVFVIEPSKIPLVWNGQTEDQFKQELNLDYVVRTRAQSVLTYVEEEKQ